MDFFSQHELLFIELKENLQISEMLLIFLPLYLGCISIDEKLEILFPFILEDSLACLFLPHFSPFVLDTRDEFPLSSFFIDFLLSFDLYLDQILDEGVTFVPLLRFLLPLNLLQLLLQLINFVLFLFIISKIQQLLYAFLVLFILHSRQKYLFLFFSHIIKFFAEGHFASISNLLEVSSDKDTQIVVFLVLDN